MYVLNCAKPNALLGFGKQNLQLLPVFSSIQTFESYQD